MYRREGGKGEETMEREKKNEKKERIATLNTSQVKGRKERVPEGKLGYKGKQGQAEATTGPRKGQPEIRRRN